MYSVRMDDTDVDTDVKCGPQYIQTCRAMMKTVGVGDRDIEREIERGLGNSG